MKKKKSIKKMIAISSSTFGFLFAVTVSGTIVMNYFSPTMDMFFGRGEKKLIQAEGVDKWDKNYYGEKLDSSKTKEESGKIAKEISDEGIVLLKNKGNALPLKSNEKITPLGRGYVDPIYGGNGSGNVDTSQDYIVSAIKAMGNGFQGRINKEMENHLLDVLHSNKYRRGSIGMNSSSYQIGEFPVSEYTGMESSLASYSDVGLVFISRGGGEGGDLTTDMSKSGGKKEQHQLELDDNEKALIEYSKSKFKKTVLILNLSTSMELGSMEEDEGIDAILWIGSPGAVGFSSMADILKGDVNPSGKTVDTFAADFTKDPSYQNFGNFRYTNVSGNSYGGGSTPGASYVEYEENIYVGYRYYETAYSLYGDDFYNQWKNSTDKNEGTGVVYPFGYGLSYTTFDQKILNVKEDENSVHFDVVVTNTGDVAGKDSVQIYLTPSYDSKNGIEKAYVNLIDFGKTEKIEPKESKTLSFDIQKEDFASYDYKNEKCYVLTAGTYTLKLMKNAHEMYEDQKIDVNVGTTIVYDKDNPRQSEIDAQSYLESNGTFGNKKIAAKSLSDSSAGYVAATNQFDDVSKYVDETSDMISLSRNDFKATFPTKGMTTKEAPEQVVEDFKDFDVENDPNYGNVESSVVYHESAPVSGKDNGLSLIDMRGLNYYDSTWDSFLDQLTYSDDELLVTVGANYQTLKIDSIGKPATDDHDGPQGLTGTYGTGKKIDAFAWCSEPLVAATFNKDLARKMGTSIGKEALSLNISGWYGPAMNLHRSPFGGRNFEYYSEDPLLTGKIGAQVIGGAGDSGLYAYVKHFALNDQETNRLRNICVWANEQAIREIYLKPFEIAVKEARCQISYIADAKGTLKTSTMRACTAMMSSFNRIGSKMTCQSYPLLTTVLRDEWGFAGTVVTDMMGGLDYDLKLRSGNDLNMDGKGKLSIKDKSSDTAKHAFRKAIKNVCYTVVNSNAMVGMAPGTIITYKTSPWKVVLIAVNVVSYSLVVGAVCFNAYHILRRKKHPNDYR